MPKNHNPGAKNSTCSKCGAEAHSIPTTPHRRCPGQADQPLRAKHDLIEGPLRGRWQ